MNRILFLITSIVFYFTSCSLDPDPTYDCDGNGNCYDTGDGNGQFSNLYDCEINCNELPIGPCNITSETSGSQTSWDTPYIILLSPSSNTNLEENVYNFGDEISITMYHPMYTFSSGNIYLYKNETYIDIIGTSSFYQNQATAKLPNGGAGASNCYTVRVSVLAGTSVSHPITIY